LDPIIFLYIKFFLSKIDTYKPTKYQGDWKKNQIETNYIVQLIINQILSDEIKKNKLENLKKIQIVIDQNKKEKRVNISG
jgi:hypothetical protein